MATQRTDRTGRTYGALHVLALSAHDGRKWWVRWECCGRGEFLDSMVISHSSKHPPTCCKACAKAPKAPAKAKPKPDLRVRTKTAQEAIESARGEEGLRIPGRGWWPFLHGPMGPRHGTGYGGYSRFVDHG